MSDCFNVRCTADVTASSATVRLRFQIAIFWASIASLDSGVGLALRGCVCEREREYVYLCFSFIRLSAILQFARLLGRGWLRYMCFYRENIYVGIGVCC